MGVIEHIVLLSVKPDAEGEAVERMLDELYSLQYQVPSVLALSVGKKLDNGEGGEYTHALVVRFPNKAALEAYQVHPEHVRVVQEVLKPLIDTDLTLAVDYEACVEGDIEPMFNRGDEWDVGVEHIVLLRETDGGGGEGAEAMREALEALPDAMAADVRLLQLTAGANFSQRSKGYTFALLARLGSEEDLALYGPHPEHQKVVGGVIKPRVDGRLALDFALQPVEGKQDASGAI